MWSGKARLWDLPPYSHSADSEMCSFAVVSFLTKQSTSCHVFLPLFLRSVVLAFLSHILSRCGGKWMITLDHRSIVSKCQLLGESREAACVWTRDATHLQGARLDTRGRAERWLLSRSFCGMWLVLFVHVLFISPETVYGSKESKLCVNKCLIYWDEKWRFVFLSMNFLDSNTSWVAVDRKD